MATQELHPRIYTRERERADGQTVARYYADFRDYSDVGGAQEALKPEGAKRATTDPEIAETLVTDRLEELKAARRRRVDTGVAQAYGLKEFAALHLERKAEGDVSESWLVAVEKHLGRAVAHFGADAELSSVRPSDVRTWVAELRETSNGRGGTLSEKTVRDHLNSLSNLYRRAQGKEAVPGGYNPVKAWLGSVEDAEKPSGGRTKEASWLEPHEAALLIEAARHHEPAAKRPYIDFMHPLVATFLLTGGRKSEVLGLEVSDVDLDDRHVIRFAPNEHRDLKTDTSTRTVPVWPQLAEILSAYLESPKGPEGGLLFPSPKTGKMLTDVRKQLDAIGETVGFEKGEVRLHKLRHTYTAARIQTTEHGAPVALFTVARELGHSSTRLIERRYGHLLTNRRVRSDVVAFRPETYEEEIGEQIHELRLVS